MKKSIFKLWNSNVTSVDVACNEVTQTVVITRYAGVIYTKKRSVLLVRHTSVSHTLSDCTVPYRLWSEDIYRNRVFIEVT